MDMSSVHQVWLRLSWKAQWKGAEDKADKRRSGKTTSENRQAWHSQSSRGQWTTEKWRKLVVKSSVVPQQPSRLRDRWRWRLCTRTMPALTSSLLSSPPSFRASPQYWAADAEIKVPFGENAELKRSPFKAWSRSVYSHTSYAYCQEFLPCLFLPFRSIHLHFFQNLSRIFLCCCG